ncbi:MAG: xanthine dehydrogenase family protein molybdopterin-binding subunit [Acidobacteriota bacterium]|nr:xanthine dehydrogenase family protein molybdopterin-binding subunit [Acidobacteriota bacterium]
MMEETQTHPRKQMGHRYDGVAKVTGTAKYVAEFSEPFSKKEMLYGYVVQAAIPAGTVVSMDHAAAERSPGVVAVLTPFNAPKLPAAAGDPKPPAKRRISVLQDADVSYSGQPIAVVVARSLVEAQQAARLLKVRYKEEPAKLEFMKHLDEARLPKLQSKEPASNRRGDIAAGMAKATVTVEGTYITPIQNHNPMEPHATIAWWEGEKLNVYDSTQYITGVKMSLAKLFQIPLDDVRVRCPNTGGGFGSKGSTWSHVGLAVMASKVVGKPVKIALGREQMFGPVGARPSTVNKIKIGATADGKIVCIEQDVAMNASVMEDFTEHSAGPAKMLYDIPTLRVSEKLVEQNLGVSTYQRAPGEAPGTAVLEIAMDELAEKLKMDPLQLRLVNYAEKDPSRDRPWTSKHLREAYAQAAERFGWSKRNAQPGTVKEGDKLIGYGMATATYPANRSPAQAVVRILPGGRAFVGSGTQDLGTGMYTMLAQTCADALGIDASMVEAKLGDSTLPHAPVSGGSQSTASVTPAVVEACTQAKLKLAELAIAQEASPLHGLKTGDIEARGGKLVMTSDPARADTFAAIIARGGNQPVEAMGSSEPGADRDAYTSNSWGAVFAEVAVDVNTHMVEVRRVVATYDIGTLMNDKTGINQLQGGIVWGIGFALHEETHIDPVYGRTVNENFAEYHVPVNADIGTLDVTVLNIPDTKFNPLGARGIGEIGITGAAAAVANAIYNATGKRVRDYPITPDKLMKSRG